MLRKALVDSSSAIILFKSGLFDSTTAFYRIVMANSVIRELIIPERQGAGEFKRHQEEGRITIRKALSQVCPDGDLHSLDAGELETILLFHEGAGDFIMLDDGKGAAYCRSRRIPHINALLVPRIFKRAGMINASECAKDMEIVRRYGRYSRRVIDYAHSCSDDDLESFS